jgi:non-heme chloroperoxidase
MVTSSSICPATTRRKVLVAAAVVSGASILPKAVHASPSGSAPKSKPKGLSMGTINTKDGTEIFFKDWGEGQPIMFHHGWPLSADDWDAQMMFFLDKGFRVIAHDRRGHGRSTQTDTGNDMDTYADDLAALITSLDLKHVPKASGHCRPEPVVLIRQDECLVPPKTAVPLSGSRIERAHDG